MSHTTVKLSTGTIDIFDGVVPMYKMTKTYNHLTGPCSWHIGWSDRTDTDPNLYCEIHDDWVFELIEPLAQVPHYMERMEGMGCNRVVGNLSHASSVHYTHTHPNESLVLLYYANRQWEEHWEGETMFFAENGEVEYTNKYTPGRILLFDATMPHTIRAQSPAGPPFRFSMSYFWSPHEPAV